MPRRVQDILPGDRRSIRDIPIERKSPVESGTRNYRKEPASTNTREVKIHRVDKGESIGRMLVTPPPSQSHKKRNTKWLLVTTGAILVIAGVGFVASTYFSKATFTIVPKTIPFSVDGTFVAKNSVTDGSLAYDLVTIHGTASTTVPASDGPAVSTKAQGKVTVYNSYSAKAMTLIAGTRISNDSGLIYKLKSSIVIPGYTKKGDNTIPGSITTSVIADQAGESYNISHNDSISDFKIVAYKDSPKYDYVYARIASDFKGGFVGTKKIISPTVTASTTELLKTKLTSSLVDQIKTATPEGYIMYDNSYVVSFSPVVVGGVDSDSASITEEATLNGILFKKSNLIANIGGAKAITSFGDFTYDALGLEKLEYNISNLKDFSPEKKNTLIVHFKGDLKLVGIVPIDELKKKFAGISLAETVDVLKAYISVIDINKSSGELAPPWAKVPSDPQRVVIKIQKP
jgi:hypothetical protein